jgi:tRNA A-37 threonylcarbamoyl transferase component Bud32
MNAVKDTQRALVRVGFDGQVTKTFRGPLARQRFDNECRVLNFLERKNCPFVPRLLDSQVETLTLITSNCGQRVERLERERRLELFAELETYGVRHEDPSLRNVTYRQTDGRFCLIDFEFALVLDDPEQAALRPPPPEEEPE